MQTMTMTRHRGAAAALAALALVASVAAEDVAPAGGEARTGRLDVAGGRLDGGLVPVPEIGGTCRETFLWRSPRFATPFEFRLGEVAGITFPPQPDHPRPPGPFVHLRGGDLLAATIESLDADALVATTAGPDGPQRLRIARDEVEAISRAGAGGGSYVGPAGLAGWEQAPAGSWREEAGRIMTEKAGASVTRDVAAPARARFDIRLSRRKAAEFRLALAAAERPADDEYVFQAVGGDAAGGMMLVRRAGGRAAIEPLPAVPWRGDTLRVVLFVDQAAGRVAAILPDAEGEDGRRVTEAQVPPVAGNRPSGRVRLELASGDICLDRIRVGAWSNAEPTLREAAETTIVTRAGGLEGYGVTSFDAAGGEYVLARGGETKRVAAAEVEEIRFPDAATAQDDATVRVVRYDGGTLAGDLVKIDDRALWLRRRGVDAAVAIPLDAIAAIRCQRPAPNREEPGGRVGTLVAGEDRLRGWLVGDAAEGIGWRPLGSANAAAFAERPAAEVEYVAPRPVPKKGAGVEVGGIGGLVNRDADGFWALAMMTEEGAAARDGRLQPGDRILAVAPAEKSRFVDVKELDQETVTRLLRGVVGTTVRLKVVDAAGANPRGIGFPRGPISVAGADVLAEALQTHRALAGAVEQGAPADAAYPSSIVLRSGDEVPCRIERIDADGVLLKSPLTGGLEAEAVRVPVALVKAVELANVPRVTIDPAAMDWLLTLPRMQRDRPPTHLIRLVEGDYVRGWLQRLDEKTVMFEMLEIVKELPRAEVARIIWLHPDVPRADENEDAPKPEPVPEDDGLLVQGIGAGGRRTTLVADTVAGNVLRGHCRAFGPGRIDLGQVDRLLIGGAIGRDDRQLPFAQWTLKPAREPRALSKPDEK
ncbi:MAG: hypothetical protein ACKOSQ_08755 [Planctomycetaceae bacterium]